MPWNISTKEEKEQKTQEYLLNYLFGDLYSQLNLEQFITDKEKGSVDTKKLGAYLKQKGFSDDAVNSVEEYLTSKAGDEEFRERTKSQLTLEYAQIQTIDNGLTKLGITLTEEQRMNLILQILSHEVNISDEAHLIIWITVGKGEGFGNEEKIKIELTDEMEKAVYKRNHSEEMVRFKENSNSPEEFDSQLPPELRDDESLHRWLVEAKISECTAKRDFAEANRWKKEGEEWALNHGYNPIEFMKGVYDQFKLMGGTDIEWVSVCVGYDISHIFDIEGVDKLVPLAISLFEFSPNYLDEYIEKVLRPMFGGTEEMQAGEAVVIKSKPKS